MLSMAAWPAEARALQLPRVVFQLTLGSVEGVAQRDVDILIGLLVDHDFRAGYAEVDADVEELALLLMLGRLIDHDAAADDVGKDLFEFLGLVADVGVEGFGRRDVAEGDL